MLIIHKILKTILVVFVGLFCAQVAKSQKPIVDIKALRHWEELGDFDISPNGKFIWYARKQSNGDYITVIETVDRQWKKEIPTAFNAKFTSDSKFILIDCKSGILILSTETKSSEELIGCSDLQVAVFGNDWITYRKGSNLEVRNLITGKKMSYQNILLSKFNETGDMIVLRSEKKCVVIDLKTQTEKNVVNAVILSELGFDQTGRQLTFATRGKSGGIDIRYYKADLDSAYILVSGKISATGQMSVAEQTPSFSKDGKSIFFYLTKSPDEQIKDTLLVSNKVNVWSYNDNFLQSEQRLAIKNGSNYLGVVNIKTRSVNILESDSSHIVHIRNRYALLRSQSNISEVFWNRSQLTKYKLIDLTTFMSATEVSAPEAMLSPDERFLIWYDLESKNYNLYNIKTSETTNISECINRRIQKGEPTDLSGMRVKFMGWLANDKGAIFCDDYDVWSIKLSESITFNNITGGKGRLNKIIFRPAINGIQMEELPASEKLLLCARDLKTNFNGLLKLPISKNNNAFTFKIMDSLCYFKNNHEEYGTMPVKARNAEMYLVTIQTASTAPNLFLTRDFISFFRFTDICPEKKYNWLKSEVVSYKLSNGQENTGILYKPENFDPSKKYPIIFFYYQLKSGLYNTFLKPKLSDGDFEHNIPIYVSDGYIVFVPDIWTLKENPGQSALMSVLSGVDYLKKYQWIDTTRMGLQGHSFGGYETNYIVTHSNIFSAACSAAGTSNVISSYGQLNGKGGSRANMYEILQSNLGAPPWEKRTVYVKNSPVLFLNQVSSPLLIMHNINDGAVPFAQAVELFTGLRRLKKRAWLLEYDGEGHGVTGEQSLDFTIRMKQFFDHYLKKRPAPLWMIDGIPAKYKGVKSGLQLDALNRTP